MSISNKLTFIAMLIISATIHTYYDAGFYDYKIERILTFTQAIQEDYPEIAQWLKDQLDERWEETNNNDICMMANVINSNLTIKSKIAALYSQKAKKDSKRRTCIGVTLITLGLLWKLLSSTSEALAKSTPIVPTPLIHNSPIPTSNFSFDDFTHSWLA